MASMTQTRSLEPTSYCGRSRLACHLLVRPEAEVVSSEPRVPSDIISDLTKEWYDNRIFLRRQHSARPIHVLHGDCVRRVGVRRWRFEEPEGLKKEDCAGQAGICQHGLRCP